MISVETVLLLGIFLWCGSVNDNHSLYVLSKHICTVVASYFKEQ